MIKSNLWSVIEQRRYKLFFWRDHKIAIFAIAGRDKIEPMQTKLTQRKASFWRRYIIINHSDLPHELWKAKVRA